MRIARVITILKIGDAQEFSKLQAGINITSVFKNTRKDIS